MEHSRRHWTTALRGSIVFKGNPRLGIRTGFQVQLNKLPNCSGAQLPQLGVQDQDMQSISLCSAEPAGEDQWFEGKAFIMQLHRGVCVLVGKQPWPLQSLWFL